ncbi:MAG: hypothetical protein LBR79_01090 [Oscillospiraceae bacterium]|nr:hypothetical protein [Oscillospiraceae bacterium]
MRISFSPAFGVGGIVNNTTFLNGFCYTYRQVRVGSCLKIVEIPSSPPR